MSKHLLQNFFRILWSFLWHFVVVVSGPSLLPIRPENDTGKYLVDPDLRNQLEFGWITSRLYPVLWIRNDLFRIQAKVPDPTYIN